MLKYVKNFIIIHVNSRWPKKKNNVGMLVYHDRSVTGPPDVVIFYVNDTHILSRVI